MRTAILGVVGFLAAAVALPVSAACVPERLDLRGPFGAVAFNVTVADDPDERSRGLMFVESMATFTGMLFVYERPQPVAFWMENTLIPLDMIFMDSTGTVRHVHENAVPLDRTPIPGGSDDILMVLEVNGGLSGRLGIGPGAQMRHPAAPQDLAAWPCE